MDAGRVPERDTRSVGYEEYPSEMYAGPFAFMSLGSADPRIRDDYVRCARALMMHFMNSAVKRPAAGKPLRDPAFATSDRSRWYDEAFPLTVDWIYPYLSSHDRATIRTVFLRWIVRDIVAIGIDCSA
jgi:hypothetical protein